MIRIKTADNYNKKQKLIFCGLNYNKYHQIFSQKSQMFTTKNRMFSINANKQQLIYYILNYNKNTQLLFIKVTSDYNKNPYVCILVKQYLICYTFNYNKNHNGFLQKVEKITTKLA
jgi:hypothetical protein